MPLEVSTFFLLFAAHSTTPIPYSRSASSSPKTSWGSSWASIVCVSLSRAPAVRRRGGHARAASAGLLTNKEQADIEASVGLRIARKNAPRAGAKEDDTTCEGDGELIICLPPSWRDEGTAANPDAQGLTMEQKQRLVVGGALQGVKDIAVRQLRMGHRVCGSFSAGTGSFPRLEVAAYRHVTRDRRGGGRAPAGGWQRSRRPGAGAPSSGDGGT